MGPTATLPLLRAQAIGYLPYDYEPVRLSSHADAALPRSSTYPPFSNCPIMFLDTVKNNGMR